MARRNFRVALARLCFLHSRTKDVLKPFTGSLYRHPPPSCVKQQPPRQLAARWPTCSILSPPPPPSTLAIGQVRDYKQRAKTLHRQHRGIMQWKIPRTAKWVKNKLGRVEDNVSGIFEHETPQKADIETEV
ncbi:hypothetical protein NQ176_g1926 [Zarea fungicola]|uniref:Uncharacterized protein n=1 Tax=Zarea fungicola TaxID=93591 RepID=A0ACC1NRW0_9HYPO|nr:hypothetical protein NQ176_g1926 [Lecanicillium fungicola]